MIVISFFLFVLRALREYIVCIVCCERSEDGGAGGDGIKVSSLKVFIIRQTYTIMFINICAYKCVYRAKGATTGDR